MAATQGYKWSQTFTMSHDTFVGHLLNYSENHDMTAKDTVIGFVKTALMRLARFDPSVSF